MKKLLTLVFGVIALTFCGCAGKGTEVKASNEPSGKISTYLKGAHVSVSDAEAKLTAAGFEVLTKYASVKDATTIVFTSPALKAEGAKPGRAYISVMRMFIDDQEKTISITNPVYFGKAFMQKDYNYATFAAVKAKIDGAFPGLTSSPDKMDYDELAGFHFTIGMPYYEDQAVVGEGTNADLLAKAKAYKNGKNVAFELKLSETSTLLGFALGAGTKRFVMKIGRANAGLLPWTISIEDGKAKILQGQYYIALHYPLLDMGGFMGIMSTPDSVIKDLSKPFN
jgi:hypothetical protein